MPFIHFLIDRLKSLDAIRRGSKLYPPESTRYPKEELSRDNCIEILALTHHIFQFYQGIYAQLHDELVEEARNGGKTLYDFGHIKYRLRINRKLDFNNDPAYVAMEAELIEKIKVLQNHMSKLATQKHKQKQLDSGVPQDRLFTPIFAIRYVFKPYFVSTLCEKTIFWATRMWE